MARTPLSFDVEIRRILDIDALEDLSDEEAEEADESGYLAGNQAYRDLRGWDWTAVGEALDVERGLIRRLQDAADPALEEELFNEERLQTIEPVEELWGLDVGVAAATIAISALGGSPVSSCNAGAFGNHHQARHPYVAFYLPKARGQQLLELAEAADVGLIVDAGLAQIYARTVVDLFRFAELAWTRRETADPK
jgi:hypothetical protein